MNKKQIKEIFNGLGNLNISGYSAQCSYFIILSFIPFIILLLTLIQYVGLDKQALIEGINSIIPQNINNIVIDIIQEIYSKSIGTISVSIIFILWSAGKGFFALCKGLNSIYEVKKKYNYFILKLRSMIYTIAFIFMIVITLLILVFGNKINIFINGNFSNIAKITNSVLPFSKMIMFGILFLFFLLIYRFIPKHKIKLKKHLPGALFASISWIILSYLFSIYLDIFSGFSIMYGSLTTVMLLFIWIYSCIYILLLGAAINKYLIKNEKQRAQKNEKTN